MRMVVLAAAVTLALTSSVYAQGNAPRSDPGMAPAAEPDQDAEPSDQRGPRGRRGRRGADAGPPATCDQGSAAEIRKCKADNVRALQRAINRKVAQDCNRRVAATGARGPAAADERVACRYDLMSRLLESLN